MTVTGWVQVAVFVVVVTALTPMLGAYMARVFGGERVLLACPLGPLERAAYRLAARPARGAGRGGDPANGYEHLRRVADRDDPARRVADVRARPVAWTGRAGAHGAVIVNRLHRILMPAWPIFTRPARHGADSCSHGSDRDRSGADLLRRHARPARGAGSDMSGAELFMLVVSVVLFGYLMYALLRGERL